MVLDIRFLWILIGFFRDIAAVFQRTGTLFNKHR